jgi:hypothetical protein
MSSTAWRLAASGVVFMAAAGAQAQDGYEWPRLLVIGTPGTASGSFASTNGWAPVLQQDVGATVRVVPEDSEPQRYRRLNVQENIALSSVSTAEMRFQTEGIGGYASAPPAAQRIVWHHNDTPWSYVVAGDSEYETLSDLKAEGTRVARGMFSPPMMLTVDKALPAFLGMSPEEAQETWRYAPASSYVANCRSVVEGQADVSFCSPISSVSSEMEGAPGGIRWLEMPPDDEDAWKRYLEHRPMHVPSEISLGVSSARGVHGITSNFVYAAPADADADFVYNLAKWLHEAHDDYADKHPLAARMSLEQFRNYLDRAPLPVHEGTVRYLREIGAWTEEDDAWNEEARAKMDRWVEAREKAMAAAREQGVDIDFQNEAFLEILSEHTQGLEGFRTRL